jgi:hypothetical protein
MTEETIAQDDSKEAVVRMSAAIENAPYVLQGEFETAVVEAFCSCTTDTDVVRSTPGREGSGTVHWTRPRE